MIKKLIILVCIVTSLLSNTIIEEKQFELVQSIIPGTKIQKVKTSPISGMYEAYFEDGSLMYVLPDKRLIFIGEIYTNTGESITQNSINESKTKTNIKDPLDESIEKLKVISSDNQKYLKELIENGVIVGKNEKQKYYIVLFKSLSCSFCQKLDEYLLNKEELNLSIYLAPGKDSEDSYLKKYNIKDPSKKLKEQINLLSKRIKGFGVPYALVIDKNYNLLDTIQGFNEDKWNKYLNEK